MAAVEVEFDATGRYKGFDEAMFLYVLGMGSPTHPASADAWEAFTDSYLWGEFYGHKYVQFSPLFEPLLLAVAQLLALAAPVLEPRASSAPVVAVTIPIFTVAPSMTPPPAAVTTPDTVAISSVRRDRITRGRPIGLGDVFRGVAPFAATADAEVVVAGETPAADGADRRGEVDTRRDLRQPQRGSGRWGSGGCGAAGDRSGSCPSGSSRPSPTSPGGGARRDTSTGPRGCHRRSACSC